MPGRSAAYGTERNSAADATRSAMHGILLFLGASVSFACMNTLAKYASQGLHVVEVTWGRYAFSLLFIALLVRRVRQKRPFASARPLLQIVRSALLLGVTLLFFAAIRFMPLVDAVAIGQTAKHIPSAEAVLPELVRQDDDRLSGEIFFDGVRAAQRGTNSERGKYVGRHGQARHIRGLAVDDQRQIRRTHHSEVLEGPRPLAPRGEVGGSDYIAAGATAVCFPHGDEATGVAVWQRFQHHRAHDAEHGRGRADGERQRQERRSRETRRAPQQAKAVTNIAQRVLDHGWARVMCTAHDVVVLDEPGEYMVVAR